MLDTLVRGDLLRTLNFIGGRWCPAASGHELAAPDPGSLATVARVADSAAAPARAALDAARAAFPAWRDRTGRERDQLLKKWNALTVANQEDLARIISAEQGKPLAEARGEVGIKESGCGREGSRHGLDDDQHIKYLCQGGQK